MDKMSMELKSASSHESCDIPQCDCEAKRFYEKYKDKIDQLISNQFRRTSDSQREYNKTPTEVEDAIKDLVERLLRLEGAKIFPPDVSTDTMSTTYSTSYTDSSLLSIKRYLQAEPPCAGEEEAEPLSYIPEKELYQISTAMGEEEIEYISRPEREKKAENYLQAHRVYELFRFLGAHLLSHNPDNPIDYLIILLDNCLRYRQGILEPPLLFEEKHVVSLFNSMDPMRTGFINMKQYHTGMITLGTDNYNNYPPQNHEGFISKEFFVKEALRCLKWQLDDMIKIPKTPSTTAIWPSLQRTDSSLTTWILDKSGRGTPAPPTRK